MKILRHPGLRLVACLFALGTGVLAASLPNNRNYHEEQGCYHDERYQAPSVAFNSSFCLVNSSSDCKAELSSVFADLNAMSTEVRKGLRGSRNEALGTCWVGFLSDNDVSEIIDRSLNTGSIAIDQWVALANGSKNEPLALSVYANLMLRDNAYVKNFNDLAQGLNGELSPMSQSYLMSVGSEDAARSLFLAIESGGYYGRSILGEKMHNETPSEPWRAFLAEYLIRCLNPFRLFFGLGHPNSEWSFHNRLIELRDVANAWFISGRALDEDFLNGWTRG